MRIISEEKIYKESEVLYITSLKKSEDLCPQRFTTIFLGWINSIQSSIDFWKNDLCLVND